MLVAKKILVFATLGLLLTLASGAQADPQRCEEICEEIS